MLSFVYIPKCFFRSLSIPVCACARACVCVCVLCYVIFQTLPLHPHPHPHARTHARNSTAAGAQTLFSNVADDECAFAFVRDLVCSCIHFCTFRLRFPQVLCMATHAYLAMRKHAFFGFFECLTTKIARACLVFFFVFASPCHVHR